jgi:hypothetical protein
MMMRKLGWSGKRILSSEPWWRIKGFHAGGEAKWWLANPDQDGPLAEQSDQGVIRLFFQLTSERYAREEAFKLFVRRLDHYQVFRYDGDAWDSFAGCNKALSLSASIFWLIGFER